MAKSEDWRKAEEFLLLKRVNQSKPDKLADDKYWEQQALDLLEFAAGMVGRPTIQQKCTALNLVHEFIQRTVGPEAPEYYPHWLKYPHVAAPSWRPSPEWLRNRPSVVDNLKDFLVEGHYDGPAVATIRAMIVDAAQARRDGEGVTPGEDTVEMVWQSYINIRGEMIEAYESEPRTWWFGVRESYRVTYEEVVSLHEDSTYRAWFNNLRVFAERLVRREDQRYSDYFQEIVRGIAREIAILRQAEYGSGPLSADSEKGQKQLHDEWVRFRERRHFISTAEVLNYCFSLYGMSYRQWRSVDGMGPEYSWDLSIALVDLALARCGLDAYIARVNADPQSPLDAEAAQMLLKWVGEGTTAYEVVFEETAVRARDFLLSHYHDSMFDRVAESPFLSSTEKQFLMTSLGALPYPFRRIREATLSQGEHNASGAVDSTNARHVALQHAASCRAPRYRNALWNSSGARLAEELRHLRPRTGIDWGEVISESAKLVVSGVAEIENRERQRVAQQCVLSFVLEHSSTPQEARGFAMLLHREMFRKAIARERRRETSSEWLNSLVEAVFTGLVDEAKRNKPSKLGGWLEEASEEGFADPEDGGGVTREHVEAGNNVAKAAADLAEFTLTERLRADIAKAAKRALGTGTYRSATELLRGDKSLHARWMKAVPGICLAVSSGVVGYKKFMDCEGCESFQGLIELIVAGGEVLEHGAKAVGAGGGLARGVSNAAGAAGDVAAAGAAVSKAAGAADDMADAGTAVTKAVGAADDVADAGTAVSKAGAAADDVARGVGSRLGAVAKGLKALGPIGDILGMAIAFQGTQSADAQGNDAEWWVQSSTLVTGGLGLMAAALGFGPLGALAALASAGLGVASYWTRTPDDVSLQQKYLADADDNPLRWREEPFGPLGPESTLADRNGLYVPAVQSDRFYFLQSYGAFLDSFLGYGPTTGLGRDSDAGAAKPSGFVIDGVRGFMYAPPNVKHHWGYYVSEWGQLNTKFGRGTLCSNGDLFELRKRWVEAYAKRLHGIHERHSGATIAMVEAALLGTLHKFGREGNGGGQLLWLVD